MKACVLKEKNENELLNDREKLVKELHDLKLKKVIGVVENPIKIRLIKRDIARINTVLKEKKIEELSTKCTKLDNALDHDRASYVNNVRVLHQHGIVVEQAPDMPKVPLMPAQPQPQPKPPVMGPPV